VDETKRPLTQLVDAQHRVIAASDDAGVLSEIFRQKTNGESGFYTDDRNGRQAGCALTPGYETYEGMAWYGAIV
jgi:hypothetical protein